MSDGVRLGRRGLSGRQLGAERGDLPAQRRDVDRAGDLARVRFGVAADEEAGETCGQVAEDGEAVERQQQTEQTSLIVAGQYCEPMLVISMLVHHKASA